MADAPQEPRTIKGAQRDAPRKLGQNAPGGKRPDGKRSRGQYQTADRATARKLGINVGDVVTSFRQG